MSPLLKDDVDDDMDISEDEGAENVEIDIHKQEHKDWNEIKTSVHIRADVENIQINIPIEYANIVEADDFQIRIYNKYIFIKQLFNYPFSSFFV